MRLPLVIVCLCVDLGTLAIAKPAGTPVVAPDGKTTFRIVRNLTEDSKTVDVSLTLPAGWKWHASALGDPKQVANEYEFVTKDAPLGGATLDVTVRLDNRDPKEVGAVAKETATELKKHVPGGGKVVRLISDARPVELGPQTHGYVTSAEIDASVERHQHYWETTCYAYRDDNRFVLTVVGNAHEQDKGLVGDFEKVCDSIRLGAKK